MAENGSTHGSARPSPEGPWRIVVEMNETLGVRVGSNLPSPDAVEMVLYRALKAIERDLGILRLKQESDRVPRVTPASHFPRGMA